MQKGEPVRCKMRAHSCVLFVTGAWSGLEATDATRQTSASARRVGWGACDSARAATQAAVGSCAQSEPGPPSDLVRQGCYNPVTGGEDKTVKLGASPKVTQ